MEKSGGFFVVVTMLVRDVVEKVRRKARGYIFRIFYCVLIARARERARFDLIDLWKRVDANLVITRSRNPHAKTPIPGKPSKSGLIGV
jgi:hypothetical protein